MSNYNGMNDDDDDGLPHVDWLKKKRDIGAYRDKYVGTRPTMDDTPTINTANYSSDFDEEELGILRSAFPSTVFSEHNTQYEIPNNRENRRRSLLADEEYDKALSEDYIPPSQPTIVTNSRTILKKNSQSPGGLGGKKRKRTTKRRKNSSKRGKRKQNTFRRKK
jgi:hypothetical protein